MIVYTLIFYIYIYIHIHIYIHTLAHQNPELKKQDSLVNFSVLYRAATETLLKAL